MAELNEELEPNEPTPNEPTPNEEGEEGDEQEGDEQTDDDETGDGDGLEQDEPATPVEQPQGPTPEDLAKRDKSLERLREHVAKRVSEIMGDDAPGVIQCPTCMELAPGWLWHPHIFPLEPEQVAATRELLGIQDASDLETHEAFTQCEKCKGAGFVQTGSKREGFEATECPTCNGLGYEQDLSAQLPANGATPTVPLQVVTTPAAPSPELEEAAALLRANNWFAAPPIAVQT